MSRQVYTGPACNGRRSMVPGVRAPKMREVLLLWLCLVLQCTVWGVWTEFDLVRPRKGAWGSEGTTPYIKIDALTNNGPNVSSFSSFGYSMAVVGDLDNNGVDDIAVGAIGEDVTIHNATGDYRIVRAGGVYVLFMNSNGSVDYSTHISSQIGGGPPLSNDDKFGFSIAALGDFDGDGVPDMAVGAPGLLIASVYVLYLHPNGTVRHYGLIRGRYVSVTGEPSPNVTFNGTVNGPPIRYGSQFGYALAAMGDLDGDNVTELAVSALDISGGYSTVYFLYMMANSTVKSYAQFGPNLNGGPALTRTFTGFGSALLPMPDFDGDNVTELIVGSMFMYDAGSENVRAGKAFFCFMHANGTVKSSQEIGELSLGPARPMPSVRNDQCGTALATIGDVNRDDYRQRQPTLLANPPRPSVPDFITGCPQTNTGRLGGRFFLMFLDTVGALSGFTEIPAETDLDDQGGGHNRGPRIAPPLNRVDGFGQSLAGYMDLDRNGIREILVGAPGDDANGTREDSGAIYIMFLRRRRHFYIPFDWVTYWVTIFVPVGCFCCSCMIGVAYFFWYFRRRPDEIEIIVKKSGYQLSPERKRYMRGTNQVYADNYTA